MSSNTFGKFDKNALENNYKKALLDEDFKKLVKSLHLTDDVLMKYTSSLEESKIELNNCKNCKNLHECKNHLTGFCKTPKVVGNHIVFDYNACKYEAKVIEEQEHSCSYFDLPNALKSAKMSDIKIDDANRIPAIKWLKNFYDTHEGNPHQKGLYLHGSFGCGKTYLICAMLNELAKKGVDVVAIYYPELLRNLKESFETDFASRVDKIKKADILFLDDIGAETVSAWARDEILGTILQYRMDSSLPTFFSSNLNIKELEEHLSNSKNSIDALKSRRIIERIKQLTCDIEIVGKNRRE